MSNDFAILAGFLDRYGKEVEGREFQEITEEFARKLGQFARGELPEPERAEVMRQLSHNPDWIWRLAEEVKTLRVESGTSA
jgi:hypothetical protein